MRVLLDTHTFLWFVFGDDKLSGDARATVEDEQCEPLVSMASIWEMTIKHGLGRLPLSEPIDSFVESQIALNDLSVLAIERKHVFGLAALSAAHKDPFDRLLAAQCLVEDLSIVSADPVFDAYGVRRIW